MFKRNVAFLVSAFALVYTATWANLPDNFRIPSQFGTVRETFEPAPTIQNSKHTIIHIQDAHCNYEAQKNLAQILEYLAKEHSLKTIMVEGGSGDVGLSYLRTYSDKKTREEVADKYLRAGKISGEEYLDIVSDYSLELYGIENESLYDAHMASFERIDVLKEEGLGHLDSLNRIIKELKLYIYSQDLRQLEEKKKSYEDKVIPLAEYCQYLKALAEKKGLNLEEFANITGFSETAKLEKEIDFKQAELERNALLKELATVLDEKGIKELISKSQEFKSVKIPAQEYYSFLKNASAQKINLQEKFPQLNSYIRYITISKHVSPAYLLKELNLIEDKIKDILLITDEQRKIDEVSKSIEILKRALNLELTPEDYAYFKTNKPKLITSLWVGFLTENCQKYNLALQLPASKAIDDNLGKLENFYRLGGEREKAFMMKALNKISETGDKLTVLIAGGFHTPGITQMLKEKGYAYMVVTPVITQKSDSDIYLSVLRAQKNKD